MLARVLAHAHKHRQVRWLDKGTPMFNVIKSRWWLELLHTIALGAIKLQIKHSCVKYMPGEYILVPLCHYLTYPSPLIPPPPPLPPPCTEAIKDEALKKFREWGIPIDIHRAGKRVEQEKWPGGGTVKVFD